LFRRVASRHETGPFARKKNLTTNNTNLTNKTTCSSHTADRSSLMQNSNGHTKQARPNIAPIPTISLPFVRFVRFVVNSLLII
jgi:hypothetical protein